MKNWPVNDEVEKQNRILHYHFAHKLLPGFVWEGDALFGILANPENKDYLLSVWRGFQKEARTKDNKPVADISPEGLSNESFWLGGEHLVFLIRFPPTVRVAEAELAAITTSPVIRYLTLEKTVPDYDDREQSVLGEWTADGTHHNLGAFPRMTETDFLHTVCRELQVQERIEPPTWQQQEGLSLKGPNINMSIPPRPSKELSAKVNAWEEEADEALMTRQDFAKAERLYRQIHDAMMCELGPENTKATLTYLDLVGVLGHQSRFAEQEKLCRKWWAHCRRYRILGHYETMMSVSNLAEALAAQGKVADALNLLRYRALLIGLSRGKDHMDAVNARQELAEIENQLGRS